MNSTQMLTATQNEELSHALIAAQQARRRLFDLACEFDGFDPIHGREP